MTPLTQQLEDKKKGCREHFIFINKYCGDKRPLGEDTDEPTWLCPHCKSEIAILEQAIAEKNEFIKDEIKFLKDESDREIQKIGKPSDWIIKRIIELEDKIKNIQSQQGNSEREPQGTSTNCHNLADFSNLLQKQRQEILEEVRIELKKNYRQYGFINGLQTVDNIIDKQLNQPKTEE